MMSLKTGSMNYGSKSLRTLLATMRKLTRPAWFSIIADEATDVCSTEQLNLSIRWVSDGYCIFPCS